MKEKQFRARSLANKNIHKGGQNSVEYRRPNRETWQNNQIKRIEVNGTQNPTGSMVAYKKLWNLVFGNRRTSANLGYNKDDERKTDGESVGSELGSAVV